jgi:hypothetical protein
VWQVPSQSHDKACNLSAGLGNRHSSFIALLPLQQVHRIILPDSRIRIALFTQLLWISGIPETQANRMLLVSTRFLFLCISGVPGTRANIWKLGHKMTVLFRRAADGIPLLGPTGQAKIISRVSMVKKIKWAMQQRSGMKVRRDGACSVQCAPECPLLMLKPGL